ncbi:MAG: ferrous iron transport protein B, partial [Deferribacteraceae bacterium]|nr:ferrous iron transport protein B [Deferribacteraceae bacterium]
MSEAVKTMTIAVVGNPNSGKTTLFNALTGSTQRVGNWPGVTVEKKVGSFNYSDDTVSVVDLPGIYALSASSEDERVSLEYILSGEMDLILNIIDGTNLERNLFLTLQLAEMNVPMIVAVNMLDIAANRKISIDLAALSKALGCPVYGLTATNKGAAEGIKQKIVEQIGLQPMPSIKVPYPLDIEQWIDAHASEYSKTAAQCHLGGCWVALQLLEQNDLIIKAAELNGESTSQMLAESILKLDFADSPEVLIAESRYQHIRNIIDVATKTPENRATTSDKVDSIVLNRILGIPLFLVMMYLVFWSTLVIGGSFIDFFDIAFGTIFVDGFGHLLEGIGAPAWLFTLLASGLGAGIQTVSTFVPIVFVMFVCLSILEDSGYMARAAFVMDRFMRA